MKSCRCLTPRGQRTRRKCTRDQITREAGRRLKVNWSKTRYTEFRDGLRVEHEHKDVTQGNVLTEGRIALAHLREAPDYYTRLDRMERSFKKVR